MGGGVVLEVDAGEKPLRAWVDASQLQDALVNMILMQLELADSAAVLFRNAAHGRLNMVYRRHDGNVGWVDPGKDG